MLQMPSNNDRHHQAPCGRRRLMHNNSSPAGRARKTAPYRG
jgi:hypothetical protein